MWDILGNGISAVDQCWNGNMTLVVQKFGGTSLADIGMIRKVASRVADAYIRGDDLVVVLSAMAGVTDKLIDLAYEVCSSPDSRELDVLLATGEQVAVSILAIMLKHMGYKAQSILAHQMGIVTDSSYGNARIIDVDVYNIKKIISNRTILIIAGFQACDSMGNITTLGRGGSDISAVAIASALKADICEIYTDVAGVYTADPNICSKARKLVKISYDEMFHMANLGAKVLHKDSITFAKKHSVKIHVRSSFYFGKGTIIDYCTYSDRINKLGITGIAYDLNYASILLKGILCKDHACSKVLSPIYKIGIPIDMLIHNVVIGGREDVIFTVPKSELDRVLDICKANIDSLDVLDISKTVNVVKLSVVGLGMKKFHADIAHVMLRSLRKTKINVIMFDVSETKVSCIIKEKHLELAVRILHSDFDLE